MIGCEQDKREMQLEKEERKNAERGQVRLLGEVESGWRMKERKAKTKEERAVAAREHMYA